MVAKTQRTKATKISSQSSKKCLTLSAGASALAAGLLIAPLPAVGTPEYSIAQKKTNLHQSLKESLRKDLELHRGKDFEALIKKWGNKYGKKSVSHLLDLSKGKSLSDTQRYIAVLASGKLGGRSVIPSIQSLVNDSSWLVRSASIRVLASLGDPRGYEQLLEKTNDKALVIRKQAVEAIGQLRIPGAEARLIDVVQDPRNYHHGKALWVPQKAILALTSYPVTLEQAKKFLPLLKNPMDNGIRLLALKFLEKRFSKNRPFPKNPKVSTLSYWTQTLEGKNPSPKKRI